MTIHQGHHLSLEAREDSRVGNLSCRGLTGFNSWNYAGSPLAQPGVAPPNKQILGLKSSCWSRETEGLRFLLCRQQTLILQHPPHHHQYMVHQALPAEYGEPHVQKLKANKITLFSGQATWEKTLDFP